MKVSKLFGNDQILKFNSTTNIVSQYEENNLSQFTLLAVMASIFITHGGGPMPIIHVD
jgi:hypothetical protein